VRGGSQSPVPPALAFDRLALIVFMEEGDGLVEVSGRVLVAAQPQVDSTEPGQCPGLALTGSS
jgi:hypothetical protein